MASRFVKALKNATKPSSKSHDSVVEEPEIVAVIPPPQDPKRSQPPPTPPQRGTRAAAPTAAVTLTVTAPPPLPQQQPSPPLSPVVHKLEETKLTGAEPEFTMLAELPDTSIQRPKSREGKAKKEPVEGQENVDGGEEAVAKPKGQERLGKEKKKGDPAVLVEIPKSPSAQAYEVAHSHKLQDQYFNPVFEDESRTPRDTGASPPNPEKVVETLKAVATETAADS